MDDVRAASETTGTKQEPRPARPETAKEVERVIRERLYGHPTGSVHVKRPRQRSGLRPLT
jgi:hypothetical protein